MPPIMTPGRHIGYPGTSHKGPIYSGAKRAGDAREIDDIIMGQNRFRFCEREEDFLWDESPVATDLGQLYDHSPAGSPTLARIADEPDGVLQIKPATTNELETLGYYWGDQVMIPATKAPVVDFIFEVTTLPSTNERVFLGLVTEIANILALQQNLTLLSRRIGFALNASGALTIVSDDGTTDTGYQTPQYEAPTLVAGTQYIGRIDLFDVGRISFQFADWNGDNWREIGYTAAPLLAATDKLQIGAFVQKDSGAGVPELRLDYARARWMRSNK